MGLPDFPCIQGPSRGLDTRAEEGIGCRSDAEPFLSSGVNELLSALGVHTERFLAVDVFACFQDLQTDFDVCTRDGKIHYEFDLVICEQFIDGAGVGVIFLGLRLCRFYSEVSTGFDFQDVGSSRTLKIGTADGSAPNNSNVHVLYCLSDAWHFPLNPTYVMSGGVCNRTLCVN